MKLTQKRKQSFRRRLLARDGPSCQICRLPFPESQLNLDHIIPLSASGPNSFEKCVLPASPATSGATTILRRSKAQARYYGTLD